MSAVDDKAPLNVSKRLRCCICGQGTETADDYVFMTLTTDETNAQQGLGGHAECLNRVLAPGFSVEVHLM